MSHLYHPSHHGILRHTSAARQSAGSPSKSYHSALHKRVDELAYTETGRLTRPRPLQWSDAAALRASDYDDMTVRTDRQPLLLRLITAGEKQHQPLAAPAQYSPQNIISTAARATPCNTQCGNDLNQTIYCSPALLSLSVTYCQRLCILGHHGAIKIGFVIDGQAYPSVFTQNRFLAIVLPNLNRSG